MHIDVNNYHLLFSTCRPIHITKYKLSRIEKFVYYVR